MTVRTRVASANVLRDLRGGDARRALQDVLAQGPDLVGLQEWHPSRLRLLAESGSVGVPPAPLLGRQRDGYRWTLPLLGGCVVGARTDRFSLLDAETVVLSGFGRADRPDRRLRLEPPRLATAATYADRVLGRTVSLVCFHLAPGVQARGRYREDRPLLVARHRQEVGRLQALVDERLSLGHVVHAVGDSNFDGLRLAGLTSSWEGRPDAPGTLGPRRRVDDVHGPGPAGSVVLLDSASDHRAVVADREDPVS